MESQSAGPLATITTYLLPVTYYQSPITNLQLPSTMPVIDVAAALVFREGKLLITQRYADAHLGGLWEFPGGKREPNETFEACLARELREELGIEVTVGELAESLTQDRKSVGEGKI